MVWRGECWTASISEYPRDAVESSLSDILERCVHPKYSLSSKAARGILRRAEKRGKELPKELERALQKVAGDGGAKELSRYPHEIGETGGQRSLSAPKVIRTVGDYDNPIIKVDDKPMLAANPMSDRQMALQQGISSARGFRGSPTGGLACV